MVMFKKIILLICLFVFSQIQSLYALENIPSKPAIIPRESWWANELYTELSSIYWQDILEKRKNKIDTRDPEIIQKAQEDYGKALKYINENFKAENTVTHQEDFNLDTWERYAWPLKYTDYVNAIVVHHTHSEHENSLQGIQDIYKYHALNREWGDIGYNYLIWYDGEIFEGRKGWDYVAWAHVKWNNYSTVWISIIGDYHDKWINE